MSESTSYSMMGSVLKQSQDREGVRIDTPHGWVINDVHHEWTKNETYHWETGNIFHMTSGQVYHANLNLAEVHTTTNALTMHVDITPLNVHMRPLPIGFDVHIEASHFRKHVNVHGGHHHQLVSNFHQESNAVHITSTKQQQTGWDKAADLLAHGPDADHLGTMTLEADGEMTLESMEKVTLQGGSETSLYLGPNGFAAVKSKTKTFVGSDKQVAVNGGGSTINVKKDQLDLTSGSALVSLTQGNLKTSANKTELNGTVHIGQPAITGMATTDDLEQARSELTQVDDENLAKFYALKSRLRM
jgi:hypothetical protein